MDAPLSCAQRHCRSGYLDQSALELHRSMWRRKTSRASHFEEAFSPTIHGLHCDALYTQAELTMSYSYLMLHYSHARWDGVSDGLLLHAFGRMDITSSNSSKLPQPLPALDLSPRMLLLSLLRQLSALWPSLPCSSQRVGSSAHPLVSTLAHRRRSPQRTMHTYLHLQEDPYGRPVDD